MRKTLITVFLLTSFVLVAITPVHAQQGEPVQLPDGTFVLPGGEDGADAGTDTEGGEENADSADQTNDFVTGIAVGVAVGFVGGGLIAWFLKPGEA